MHRSPGSRSSSTALAVLAALALVLGLLGAYVDRAVFSADGFSSRATAALRDDDVRTLLARDITDKLVLGADADLLAARPLIQSVVSGLLGSGPFTSVFEAAVGDVHRAVFEGDANTVTLTLRDIGTATQAALRIVDPELAARLGAHRDVAVRADLGAFMARAARAARNLRIVSVVLLALALVLGAAAILRADDRRRAIARLGVAVSGAALVTVGVLALARAVVVRSFDGSVEQDAARGIWEAFAGDARAGAWLLAGAGAVVTAAAVGYLRPIELRPVVERAWAGLARQPQRGVLRVLRALALVAAGVLVLLDPLGFAALVTTGAGLALLLAGVVAVLRMTYDPAVAEARVAQRAERRRRGRPSARRIAMAVVAAAVVAGAVAVFTASGGIDAPRGPVTACNGHRELCNRPFDRVVLPATHNAMSAPLPGWYSSEQPAGIPTQLADGIRGVLIDTYYGDRLANGRVRTVIEGAADVYARGKVDGLSQEAVDAALRLRSRAGFSGEGERGMYLCHTFCELGATSLPETLRAIRDFLALHPGDVLVVVNQDYVKPEDFVAAVRDAGLERYAFTPPTGGGWPTLREMIRADHRLVVLAENHAGGAPWYQLAYRAVLQDTPYTFRSAALLTDPASRAESCTLKRGRPSAPLLLVNHWVSTDPVPRPSDAAKVNAREPLLARIRACQKSRAHVANLVAVNFYRTGDLFGVVDELNGVAAG